MLLFLSGHILIDVELFVPLFPLFIQLFLLFSLLRPFLHPHFNTLLRNTGSVLPGVMAIVLHLLPHFLLLSPLLLPEVFLLLLEPPLLLLFFPLLREFLLFFLLGFPVDLLADSLELGFSFQTLTLSVSGVIRCALGRNNVVANGSVVASFGIGILKNLISFIDLNKLFVELPLLLNLYERFIYVFESCSCGIRMIFEGKFSELIFDLID